MDCIQERRSGSATPCHLPPPICLHTAGQGSLPLSLHCNHWRGSRKCPEWRFLCMLRKLHKLREEFPIELSSSAPDTRHGLFERRPRQLDAELSTSNTAIQAGFSQLEQTLFNEVAHLSVVDTTLATRWSSVQTRMASSWISGPRQGPSSVSTATHPIPPLTRSVPTDLTMSQFEPPFIGSLKHQQSSDGTRCIPRALTGSIPTPHACPPPVSLLLALLAR